MKPIGVAAIFVAIGLLVGAGCTWYYRDTEVADAFSEGVAYQQGVAPVLDKPASIAMTWEGSSVFAHAATIAAAGSVATETDVTHYLKIENTHETRDATNTELTLKNTYTSTEGLHDDLQTDYTEAKITLQGKTEPLYHNGAFKTVTLGDIGDGAYINVSIVFTFEVAPAGTFQDAQTYTNYIYLVQPDAEDTDSVAFTLTT